MYDSLGDRMKGYEHITRSFLIRRMPVIIRLDGKAFHTYTRKCTKPYDPILHTIRWKTLNYLCNNIQGVIIGYSQSDEISLILKDWLSFTTQPWFNNNFQKIVSVSASMCTMFWNKTTHDYNQLGVTELTSSAMFDSRAFNLPKEEVVNYLIWRQQDWERNSIQMLAQSYYSQKQMHGLSCDKLRTMVEQEHGIVWGNLAPYKKQGEIWLAGQELDPQTDSFIFKQNRDVLETLLNITE